MTKCEDNTLKKFQTMIRSEGSSIKEIPNDESPSILRDFSHFLKILAKNLTFYIILHILISQKRCTLP